MNRTVLIILLVVCVAALIFMFAVILPRIKIAMMHTPTIVYVIISVLLLAAIAILAINLFAPRGSDGVEAQPEAADVNTETRWNGEAVYVYVHGDEISVGELPMTDVSECIKTVENLVNEGAEDIYLVDDYAQASIYKLLMAGFDETGIEYRTKEQ